MACTPARAPPAVAMPPTTAALPCVATAAAPVATVRPRLAIDCPPAMPGIPLVSIPAILFTPRKQAAITQAIPTAAEAACIAASTPDLLGEERGHAKDVEVPPQSPGQQWPRAESGQRHSPHRRAPRWPQSGLPQHETGQQAQARRPGHGAPRPATRRLCRPSRQTRHSRPPRPEKRKAVKTCVSPVWAWNVVQMHGRGFDPRLQQGARVEKFRDAELPARHQQAEGHAQVPQPAQEPAPLAEGIGDERQPDQQAQRAIQTRPFYRRP